VTLGVLVFFTWMVHLNHSSAQLCFRCNVNLLFNEPSDLSLISIFFNATVLETNNPIVKDGYSCLYSIYSKRRRLWVAAQWSVFVNQAPNALGTVAIYRLLLLIAIVSLPALPRQLPVSSTWYTLFIVNFVRTLLFFKSMRYTAPVSSSTTVSSHLYPIN